MRIKFIILFLISQVNTFMLPTTLNYSKFILSPLNDQFWNLSKQQDTLDSHTQFPRRKSYLIEQDWQINKEKGGLRLINEKKKSNQGKIIKFVLKKFLTTGSFMGLSFPVFAMKSESILETYAKSISAAPILFSNISTDPVERIKKFVVFIFTFSRLFSDMDKPFNPTIGETFQTNIASCSYSAEQTSHHPPQTSFYLQGKDFVLYGTLQLVASISVNSAVGKFEGDITVEFGDGGKVIGWIPSGEMSGFLVGENLFSPKSSCYAYDPDSDLVCSYKVGEKDNFSGHIGKLKQKYMNRFRKILKSNDRFEKFESFREKDFETIESYMEAKWTKNVIFNSKVYLDFELPLFLPYEPVKASTNILPSDSSFRRDIKLREEGKMEEAQVQKQRIEEEERECRKLRKKYEKHKK